MEPSNYVRVCVWETRCTMGHQPVIEDAMRREASSARAFSLFIAKLRMVIQRVKERVWEYMSRVGERERGLLLH
jgi:hypothetical protein